MFSGACPFGGNWEGSAEDNSEIIGRHLNSQLFGTLRMTREREAVREIKVTGGSSEDLLLIWVPTRHTAGAHLLGRTLVKYSSFDCCFLLSDLFGGVIRG